MRISYEMKHFIYSCQFGGIKDSKKFFNLASPDDHKRFVQHFLGDMDSLMDHMCEVQFKKLLCSTEQEMVKMYFNDRSAEKENT